MRTNFVIGVLLFGLASFAYSNTLTVDATGGGDYTTIQAAIDAANPNDTVLVKNTGLYDEIVTITKGITLQGEDPNNRPIVALKAQTSEPNLGGAGDGLYIQVDDTTVTLKNLILIPSKTNPPTDDAITCAPATTAGTLGLVIDNVLESANNGSDQPLATSFWDDPDTAASGVVLFGDDVLFAMTNPTYGGVQGVINTHFTDFYAFYTSGSTNSDLVLYPSADETRPSSNIWNHVYLTGTIRNGTQISSAQTADFVINDFRVRHAIGSGMINYQGGNWVITNSLFLDCAGFGMEIDSDTNQSVLIDHCLYANTVAEGFWTSYAATVPKSWLIKNCTFYNCGSATPSGTDGPYSAVKMEAAVTADSTLTVRDCIVAGPNTAVENLGAGEIIFDHCNLVQLGPFALNSVERNTSTGTVTKTGTFAGDPKFLSVVTNPLAGNSFDVTNDSLLTASSTGGELTGWGDFVLILSTGPQWNLYE